MGDTKTSRATQPSQQIFPKEDFEYSLGTLRAGAAKCKTLQDHFQLIANYRGRGPFEYIRPFQMQEEICALMRLVAKLQPRCAAEIGTAEGGTLYMLTRVARPDALIVSIDLPGGPFGGGYSQMKVPFFKGLAREKQRIECLRGDSKRLGVRLAFEQILQGRYLDFLFIDGDHSYYGVKSDFENYRPYVRPGGLIAFHDIKGAHPTLKETGVMEFWKEIKPKHAATAECVANPKQTCAGIGLIRV